MPLIAIMVRLKTAEREIRRAIRKAMRAQLRAKAKEVQGEARGLYLSKGSKSHPFGPPANITGTSKGAIRIRVGKGTAYVGYVQGRGHAGPFLEQGAKHMKPRPVLEPALERVRNHPWKTFWH